LPPPLRARYHGRAPVGGARVDVRDESDEALFERYRKGDVRAFEQLLVRHRRAVYTFLCRHLRDRAAAEDLLQEVFLRVVRGASGFGENARFTTWLYTIARNLCVDAARRAVHRQTESLDAPRRSDEPQGATLGDCVADRGPAVDRQVIGGELRLRMEQAVAMLADEQREVFLMREVLDLPFKEIATIVGCPENTVKSRMRYALEKLRAALAEYRDLAQVVER
jgi:RNA polymerase sigma-70 factor (ECF subfamily)